MLCLSKWFRWIAKGLRFFPLPAKADEDQLRRVENRQLIFHLVKNMHYLPLLVLQGVDFTIYWASIRIWFFPRQLKQTGSTSLRILLLLQLASRLACSASIVDP